MKGRPLIPVALLYISGILLAALPVPLAPLFLFAFGLLLLFPFLPTARRVLLCALLVLTGWLNLAHRSAVLAPDDLRNLLGNSSASVDIRGKLAETPSRRPREIRGMEVWSSLAQIDVTQININRRGWQPATGRIMSSTPVFLPENFYAGCAVQASGTLALPELPVAQGLFDYRKYLENQGIYYDLRVRKLEDWSMISFPAVPPFADRFCAWGRKTLSKGLPIEDETLRLEWALTLGWKAALSEKVSEPFIRASTYHIFAVDGLRIAIVSGILFYMLRMFRVPRVYCGLIVAPFLLFYAALTGWPASAIRAIVMIMVVFTGWALKRPSDIINSLFAAALIILVWEPRQLFQAGFQLSFFVVLCIILIQPFFKRVEEWLLRSEPLLPDQLQSRWRKATRWSAQKIIALFLASVAAWLGSIPLVAWYFHLVTPWSGFSNVFAVPLCGLVLISNLLSLLLGGWLPFAAELFNHSGWFLMKCIQVTSQWSANWPGAYFYLPMPAFFTITLYYVALLTTMTGWLFRGKLRYWKIGGLAVLISVWGVLWIQNRPVTRLTILPLGNGYGAYLQSAGSGPDWLIDCGNDSSVGRTVKPFLRAQGVNRLSDFVLTHGEIAYIGGANSVFHLFNPQNIYTSPIHFRSPDYKDFLESIKNTAACRKPLQIGDHVGPWTVLYPAATNHFAKACDNTLVLRGDFSGARVLLLADLGHFGQNALLSGTNDLRAEIIVSGLPDENEPDGDALLSAVKPRAIIIADDPRRHASEKLKRRLLRRHVPVLYTSESRGITLSARPGRWELEAMDGTVVYSTD